jgi:hypothetical protein
MSKVAIRTLFIIMSSLFSVLAGEVPKLGKAKNGLNPMSMDKSKFTEQKKAHGRCKQFIS